MRAAQPGRLRHKLPAEQDFCEVVVVSGGGEAFVFEAKLLRVEVLQEAQGGAAQAAEVGVGVANSHAAPVFLKGRVELPMQRVLDRPVTPHRVAEALRRERFAEDVEPHVVAPLPVADRRADRHAERLQVRPAVAVGQVVGNGTDGVRPPFTGNDPQDIHRKNQSTRSGVRLQTRIEMLANAIPEFRALMQQSPAKSSPVTKGVAR